MNAIAMCWLDVFLCCPSACCNIKSFDEQQLLLLAYTCSILPEYWQFLLEARPLSPAQKKHTLQTAVCQSNPELFCNHLKV